jgi:hypothetical protein
MKKNLLNLGYTVISFVVGLTAYVWASGYNASGPGDMMGLVADIGVISGPLVVLLSFWYLYRAISPKSDADTDADAEAT